MSKMNLQKSINGGVNLLIERDAGNEVLILFGKPTISLNNWNNLRALCDEAIDLLEDEIQYRNSKNKE